MSSELSGSFDQKHVGVEDRRRRFDPGSKYGGYGGRSLVRALPTSEVSVEGYKDIYLKIRRPTDAEGNVLVSDLDKELQQLLRTDAQGKPIETAPGSYWFRLSELLEAESISKTTQRGKDYSGVIISTYSMRGVSWMTPNDEQTRKLEQRRQVKTTLVHADGRRVHSKFCESPLESILEPTLLDGAKLSAELVQKGCVPKKAMVFQENCDNCWCGPLTNCSKRSASSFLEVDLGANCRVTHVSTQGRFPPIRRTLESGMRVLAEDSPKFMNWVTSYELSYRVQSGKEWIAVGELKGNTDMTTEVAHELQMSIGALQCRYLRFRPLTYHKCPAMRIGVYGEKLGVQNHRDEAAMEHIIKYSVCHVKEHANLRRVPLGCGMCRYGCAKCSKKRGYCKVVSKQDHVRRRMRGQQGMLEEVCNLDIWNSDAVSDAEEQSIPGAEMSEAGCALPDPTGLVHAPSFSDGELSKDDSSSIGDSVCVVEEAHPFELDSDGWHAV